MGSINFIALWLQSLERYGVFIPKKMQQNKGAKNFERLVKQGRNFAGTQMFMRVFYDSLDEVDIIFS